LATPSETAAAKGLHRPAAASIIGAQTQPTKEWTMDDPEERLDALEDEASEQGWRIAVLELAVKQLMALAIRQDELLTRRFSAEIAMQAKYVESGKGSDPERAQFAKDANLIRSLAQDLLPRRE
jgi:hypothetical protein